MRSIPLALVAAASLVLLPGCIQINVGGAASPPASGSHDHDGAAPADGFTLDFEWTPRNPSVRDNVVFQATVENLGDRTIAEDAWHWDWGDGTTGSGPNASHKWAKASLTDYKVTLHVLASDGEHEVSHLILVTG